jgi:hypothetical protein
MSWKDYFIANDDKEKEDNKSSDKKSETKQEVATKFPSVSNSQNENVSFGQSTQYPTSVSNDLASKFFDAYEKAFEKINQDGYDFFEFFQTNLLVLCFPQVFSYYLQDQDFLLAF